MPESVLTFFAQPENNHYLTGQTNRKITLYLQVNAIKHEVKSGRVPLNVSLVIDKSGSMHGEKLENVKKAMLFVTNQLRAEDWVSLVNYDSNVNVMSPSQPMRNKEEMQRKIKALESGSCTNLSGGMLEGYDQVRKTKKEGFVNRVLLLSDGLANEGVTDPNQLQMIVQKKFREEGIALSTFGVGADYNEDLMTNLSEYGGGNYYFIETADKIPEMFANELQGLLAVVAQRTRVAVNIPASLKLSRVYGYPHEVENGKVLINFNDVFSEEEKAVAIEFEVAGNLEGDLNFDLDLSYEDVVDKMDKVQERRTITITPTTDADTYKSGLNTRALDNIAQFVGNDLLERAIAKMDVRDTEAAKKLLAEAKAYLEGIFKVLAPSDRLKQLEGLIKDYEGKVEYLATAPAREHAMAQKMGKSFTYMHRKRK